MYIPIIALNLSHVNTEGQTNNRSTGSAYIRWWLNEKRIQK